MLSIDTLYLVHNLHNFESPTKRLQKQLWRHTAYFTIVMAHAIVTIIIVKVYKLAYILLGKTDVLVLYSVDWSVSNHHL